MPTVGEIVWIYTLGVTAAVFHEGEACVLGVEKHVTFRGHFSQNFWEVVM